MFRKDFHVKSNTAVRGSDRRKLRSNVTEQIPALPADELIPSKDNMTVMKIFTHADYTVMVYCLQGEPIFFEWEKQLYPSVYTLWKYPHMLPTLMTWPAVLDKMLSGADLMLPGVIVPSDGLPQMSRGQICAICVPGSAAPVGVGWTVMSSADMMASGMKGKGVHTLHCYKDYLWKQGSKSHPPVIEIQPSVKPTPSVENSIPQNQPDKELTSANNVLEDAQEELNSTPNGQPVTATEATDNTADIPVEGATGGLGDTTECVEESVVSEIGPAGDSNVVDDEDVEDDIPPAEKMDRLLYQCLLHSLKSKVKKSELPLLTSTLYRNHMLPCCPKDQTLDVKKSSYKKLSKFLQGMQEDKLLTIKATGKGVDSVVEINRSHPDVRAFVVPDGQDDIDDTPQHASATSNNDIWSPPEIRECYQVTSKMLPILKPAGYSQGRWLAADEVRKAVTDYVKENELADPTDRRRVVLDPILHDAVMRKTEDSRTHLNWDKLFSRSLRELTGGYHLVLGNQGASAEGQTVKKGRIEPVEMRIQKKAGNKVVTLITKLETFGIDPKDFSHRLQKGVSASSSTSALPGQKSGGQQPVQVLVQGNQVNFIEKLLTEHYKIPRKYIRGLDLAPKSGRKR